VSVSEEVDTGCGPHHLHIAKVLAKVHCVVARATTVQVVTGVDLCHNLHAFAFKLYETRQGIQKKCLELSLRMSCPPPHLMLCGTTGSEPVQSRTCGISLPEVT
jgi:hypothetical protein